MENRPPLSGVKVLDLSRLLPGPFATQHLADLGADVIKIEEPKLGDYGRRVDEQGRHAPLFDAINRNKSSAALNLKSPEGRNILFDLVETADVLVESFRPGVLDRLSCGYDALSKRNPRIVLCSITGYGQEGPLSHLAGHDINYIAASGVGDQSGLAGQPPALSNFQIGDLAGGTLTAVMGIMAALFDAARTGRGRHVDISMTDSVLSHSVIPFAELMQTGTVSPRGEARLTGALPCYNYYETSDGRFMAVGALEAKFWKLLCTSLSRPELIECGQGTLEQRTFARIELTHIFRSRTQAEWIKHFDGVDCCVNAVLTLDEALASEHAQKRGLASSQGRLGFPIKMSRFSPEETQSPPSLGQQTQDVYGFEDTRMDELRKKDVV